MHKIMFNDRYGLTQAVIDGRKTQTRRIVPNNTPIGNWSETVKKSRYQVGEVVAVAQSYERIYYEQGLETIDTLVYGLKNHKGWRNKLFVAPDKMPYRIRITDVRVERLQDIGEDDCLAEGIRDYSTPNEKRYGFSDFKIEDIICRRTPREAYAALIDKISGKGTWKSNPYVFVYEFELVK